MRRTCLLLLLACASPLHSQSDPGASSPRGVAALLPAETVLAIDGPDLGSSIRALRDLVRSVGARLDPPFRGMVALAEPFVAGAIGVDLDALTAGSVPGPWALAVVATDGRRVPILVVHTRGEAWELDVRGATADEQDGVLVLAASAEHCRRYHEWRRASGGSLAAKPGFLAGRARRPGVGTLRLFVDVAALRGGRGSRLDPFARFMLGPNVAAVESSTRFDATLEVSSRGLRLVGRFDGTCGDRAERVLLAAADDARLLPPTPRTAFATLSLDRSVGAFWSRLDDLLSEAGAVDARAFLSIADALLGGSLVDELVPAIGEPITVFVTSARGELDGFAPVVRLPSLVLVAERRGPAAETMLRRLFRSLVSIQQIEGQRKGEVTFRLRRDEGPGGVPLDIAEPNEWRGPAAPPTPAGLTPTLACSDAWIVFASTRAGAEDALAALADTESAERVRGDVLQLAPARGAEFVRLNRDVLVLQKILDEGVPRRAAQREIDALAAILGALRSAHVAWRPRADDTAVEVAIEVGDA